MSYSNSKKQKPTSANIPFEGLSPGAIESAPIEGLKPNPRNARTHSKGQVAAIARSIKTFGFTNPILVDDHGMVLAGHGRLAAARKLGLAKVPVVRLTHLNDAQIRAFVLADNRLAERAGWDRGMLALELGELAEILPTLDLDIIDTGFEVGEIDLILADHAEAPPPAANEVESHPIPAPPKSPVTRRGDVWRLGPHRILCGDARSEADVDRLMQGERADVVVSDPPYNVRVQGHVGGRGKMRQDQACRIRLRLGGNVRARVHRIPDSDVGADGARLS